MSKVKSALGEIVDFEMMELMADFGGTKERPKLVQTHTVDPNTLVKDDFPVSSRMMGSVEYITESVSVSVNARDIDAPDDKVEASQPITIVTSESIDESTKTNKKGTK